MSNALRIEELKKKFDENPRRYFAPLANEFRKAGDLQQAISICQAHLPQQPGHMSGHIVYGQALFEARQFDQARTVFETALALDPENLIALRYLGDIAFEMGDRSGARGWYTRVLETDPRNEEIAALMAAMGAEERGATSREAPAPAAATDDAATVEPSRSQVAEARPAPPSGEAATRPPLADKPADLPQQTSADAELEKLFARPAEPPPQPEPPPSQGGFSPLAGFGGPAMSDAPPSIERPAPSLSDAGPRPQVPGAPTGTTAGDAGFVTETMAELYLKQGFADRALGVYRQLVAQNPDDRLLRERMARIEREVAGGVGGAGAAGARVPPRDAASTGRGPTVRQFLATIGGRGASGRGRGVAPPPGGGPGNSGEFRAQQEQVTHAGAGGSIDALFGGAAPSREDAAAASTLADAFNPGATAAAAPDESIAGRPAHPAATELSLDHVFRDGGNHPGSRGTPPVSYDQFFSQPAQPNPSTAHSAANTVSPDGGSDDIEQFNAWLQGLKKK